MHYKILYIRMLSLQVHSNSTVGVIQSAEWESILYFPKMVVA